MPRKAGGKMISHLLAAHGGEIFVHTLVTARSVLEDPPSISEGCGGRVTDYRITVRHIICRYVSSSFSLITLKILILLTLESDYQKLHVSHSTTNIIHIHIKTQWLL